MTTDQDAQHAVQGVSAEPSLSDDATDRSVQAPHSQTHVRTLSGSVSSRLVTQIVLAEGNVPQDVPSDADQQRRKRRKLSPKIESSTEQDTTTLKRDAPPKTLQSTIEWATKPRGNYSNENRVDHHIEGAGPSVNIDGKKSEASLAMATPGRKPLFESGNMAGRIATPQSARNNGQRHTEGDDQSTSKTTGRISKRKTLSMHGNGKLACSSAILASVQPDTVAPKSERDARAKKRVIMRNGQLVPSLVVVLAYGLEEKREALGQKVDDILSQPPSRARNIHPFFMHKDSNAMIKPSSDQKNGLSHQADSDQGTIRGILPSASVAWKDLKFSKSVVLKTVDAIQAVWPPREWQSIGREFHDYHLDAFTRPMPNRAKKKAKVIELRETENVLHLFAQDLANKPENDIYVPSRMMLTGQNIAQILDGKSDSTVACKALDDLRSEILTSSTAFDRGEAASQQNWATKYAPKSSGSVMQPDSSVLYEWLRSLAVHNVRSGLELTQAKPRERLSRKKKRHKRASDDMDDFIVDSDSEDTGTGHSTRNAILIEGPSGCGKTASVYAVAKELGFEVFEIHPGMRRSAKDIFDKVGDMAQNHLVHHGEDSSRSSSVAPAGPNQAAPQISDKTQKSMSTFFGGSDKGHSSQAVKNGTSKKEQKQSLILFEEVDILFEEDKAFWLGVQNLILQSRRPVVMTCNDIASIPTDELNLHAILEYKAQNNALATEYLTYLAAAEGHIIERQAMSTLYESKQNDLRASIMELNYWCQMTVGSKQGGLDWIPDTARGESLVPDAATGNLLKTCSINTFRTGLDLTPHAFSASNEMLQYCHEQLGLPTIDWCRYIESSKTNMDREHQYNLDQLDSALRIKDACSALDLVDGEVSPYLASDVVALTKQWDLEEQRMRISNVVVESQRRSSNSLQAISDALDPLQEEKATFPPSHGRLAPSLDTLRSSIVVDVAPYVRSIVAFEKHSEQQREDLFGSQGKKKRTTRAAMAAAEGGDKAHTRSERWFPSALDFGKVLLTANDWPQWESSTSECSKSSGFWTD